MANSVDIESGRLYHLDGIRGVAALLVALFHFSASTALIQSDLVKNGWLSVDLFFVVSGIVLDRRYFFEMKTDFRAFAAARIGRMIPVYMIMLFLMAAMDGAIQIMRGTAPHELIWPFIVNFFALQSFGLLDKLWFYGPARSISAELWMNLLLFPLFFLKRNVPILLGIAIIGAVVFNTIIDIQTSHEHGWFRCLYGLAVGVLISRTAMALRSQGAAGSVSAGQSFTSVPLAAVWFAGFYIAYSYEMLFGFAPIVFGALVLPVTIGHLPLVERIFSSRTLVFLGRISFAIYMIHYFIGGRIMRGIVPLVDRMVPIELVTRGEGLKWDGLILGTSELQGILMVAFYMMTVIILSALTLKFVETPLYGVVRRWLDTRGVPYNATVRR